jgi:hypothetical protein
MVSPSTGKQQGAPETEGKKNRKSEVRVRATSYEVEVGTMVLFLEFFLEIFEFDFVCCRGGLEKIFLWHFWAPHAEKRPKTRQNKSKGKDDREKWVFSTFLAKGF